MTHDVEDVLAELTALRGIFLADVPRLTDAIETALAAASRTPEGASRDDLIRKTHSLCGTGATFGLAAIAEAARDLEALCDGDGRLDVDRCTVALRQLRMATHATMASERAS